MQNPFNRPSIFKPRNNDFLESQVKPFAPPTNPYSAGNQYSSKNYHSYSNKAQDWSSSHQPSSKSYQRANYGGYSEQRDLSPRRNLDYGKQYSPNKNSMDIKDRNPFRRASLLPSTTVPSSNYNLQSYQAPISKYNLEPTSAKNISSYDSYGNNNYDRSDSASVATYINRITDMDDFKSVSQGTKQTPFSRPSPFTNNYMDSNPHTDRSSNAYSLTNLNSGDDKYRAFENTEPIGKDYSHLQYKPSKYEAPLQTSSGYDKFKYQNAKQFNTKLKYDENEFTLPISHSEKRLGAEPDYSYSKKYDYQINNYESKEYNKKYGGIENVEDERWSKYDAKANQKKYKSQDIYKKYDEPYFNTESRQKFDPHDYVGYQEENEKKPVYKDSYYKNEGQQYRENGSREKYGKYDDKYDKLTYQKAAYQQLPEENKYVGSYDNYDNYNHKKQAEEKSNNIYTRERNWEKEEDSGEFDFKASQSDQYNRFSDRVEDNYVYAKGGRDFEDIDLKELQFGGQKTTQNQQMVRFDDGDSEDEYVESNNYGRYNNNNSIPRRDNNLKDKDNFPACINFQGNKFHLISL